MSKKPQAVEQFFTTGASKYSDLFSGKKTGANHEFRERLRIANELCENTTGTLLDCACGSGEITFSLFLSKRYHSGTVVDISETMLTMTEKRIAKMVDGENSSLDLEFVHSDIFDHLGSIDDQSYDLILCLGLIAHTGRLGELMARLKQILKPGGKILLQSTVLNRAFTRFMRLTSAKRYERRHGYSISYFTEKEISEVCSEVGLKIVQQKNFFLGLPFGDRILPKINYRLEVAGKNWARNHGTEALFLLEHAP